MNKVIILLHNGGVALVAAERATVIKYLVDMVGDEEMITDEGTFSTVDELYDALVNCFETLQCEFGCSMGDDYCEMTIDVRDVM